MSRNEFIYLLSKHAAHPTIAPLRAQRVLLQVTMEEHQRRYDALQTELSKLEWRMRTELIKADTTPQEKRET